MLSRYSIFKSRDITLPTKVRLVKAMVFPVVMYGCESWTVKKAERRRIGAFELWCWRRLLRVPWTARRSNQSILNEISPGISLEGMMLKLKLQYFGHLMWRVNSLEKNYSHQAAFYIPMTYLFYKWKIHAFWPLPLTSDNHQYVLYIYTLIFVCFVLIAWASLVAQLVTNLLAMQETWVRSLGWEDSLEKGMATHSSILAWRIPGTV